VGEGAKRTRGGFVEPWKLLALGESFMRIDIPMLRFSENQRQLRCVSPHVEVTFVTSSACIFHNRFI
jgi:hypothetical protein